MARRKKNKGLQQVVVIGAVLIVLQVGYIYFFPHAKPLSIQDSIEEAVNKQPDVARREQLRIQLSISDFKSRNGKVPAKLDELVPLYFASVPKDPSTGKVFAYVVQNGRPIVGDPGAMAVASNANPAQSRNAGIVPANVELISALSPAVQKALIDSFNKDAPQPVAFVYDPTNKRDPFRPFDYSPKVEEDESKGPLERLDVNQFKLTAVLNDTNGQPTALVENALGRGYSVRKGAKIGLHGGEVVEILPDKMVIVETTVDFTGKAKAKTIELRLRTKEQEKKRKAE